MKRNLNVFLGIFAASVVMPAVALAQTVETILSKVGGIIRMLIPLVISIAVLAFLWGVIKYVTASDADAQKEARTTMISGIVVLFVMVSIWGLVNVLGSTVGITPGANGVPNSNSLVPFNL